MPISTLKKVLGHPGTSQDKMAWVPGPLVPGPRDPQSPGTKKSWDLETPKVPGPVHGKSPGKMPTLVLSPLIFQCRSCWYCWAKVQTAGLLVLQCTEVCPILLHTLLISKILRCCQKTFDTILKITRNGSEVPLVFRAMK